MTKKSPKRREVTSRSLKRGRVDALRVTRCHMCGRPVGSAGELVGKTLIFAALGFFTGMTPDTTGRIAANSAARSTAAHCFRGSSLAQSEPCPGLDL